MVFRLWTSASMAWNVARSVSASAFLVVYFKMTAMSDSDTPAWERASLSFCVYASSRLMEATAPVSASMAARVSCVQVRSS